MLEKIHSPSDLKSLTYPQLNELSEEIRQELISTISRHGGHLASNLGAVELTLALHLAFDTPQDKLIFDVGHQCYTHKLLTGRQELLHSLRSPGGVSGFPKRTESPHDSFDTGHSSTAISAAVGYARARDLCHEQYAVAALVGDGALTGGLCYEALNDVGSRPTPLIVLLNDNAMSISKNVGALSKHLTRLRASRSWMNTKHAVKNTLNHLPLVGKPLVSILDQAKRFIRLALVPGAFFEALGFTYLGPVDGHDIPTLVRTLKDAQALNRPVLIHAVTQKGRGYSLAEKKPEDFHGVAPFFVESGKGRTASSSAHLSAAKAVSEKLTELGETHPQMACVTAAMPQGTGLLPFSQKFPDRFFDVGIAEGHAMTFCAGLAAGGLRPFFAVYSTFLPRCADHLLHDVCLQNLPVTLLLDHAGFVPGDGATHQGIYDLALLRAMPHLSIWHPADVRELHRMLEESLRLEGPCAIRYPKSLPADLGGETPSGSWRQLRRGADLQLIACGRSCETALSVAALLEKANISSGVWNASRLPVFSLPVSGPFAVIEESCGAGGLSEALSALAQPLSVFHAGGSIPSEHDLPSLDAQCHMTPAEISETLKRLLKA